MLKMGNSLVAMTRRTSISWFSSSALVQKRNEESISDDWHLVKDSDFDEKKETPELEFQPLSVKSWPQFPEEVPTIAYAEIPDYEPKNSSKSKKPDREPPQVKYTSSGVNACRCGSPQPRKYKSYAEAAEDHVV